MGKYSKEELKDMAIAFLDDITFLDEGGPLLLRKRMLLAIAFRTNMTVPEVESRIERLAKGDE